VLNFSLSQAVHEDPDQSSGGGPARGRQVGLAGAGQHETAGRRPLIDSSLDRAKYLWHDLPFINQQREGALGQHGIGIRAYDRSFGGPVKPQPFPAMPATGCRLAARAGTHDQDGGVVEQKVAEQRID
jgi:hypothetical protein